MRGVIVLVTALALVVPATAVATTVRVSGPAAVVAAGVVKAELKMEAGDGKPVAFRALRGGIRLTDLGGDLEVRCLTGRKGARKDGEPRRGDREQRAQRGERKRGEQGERSPGTRADDRVTTCRGGALARGTHFRVQILARRVGILVPEGAAATVAAKWLKVRAADGPAVEEEPESGGADELDGLDESDAIAELEEALAGLEDE